MSESSFTDVASSNVANAHPALQNVPEISLQTIPSIVSEAGTREERAITSRQDFIGLVAGELSFEDLEISQIGFRTVLGVLSTGETLANLIGGQADQLTEERFITVLDISDLSSLPDIASFISAL